MAALSSAPRERLVADMRAGLGELERRASGHKLGAIGFCFGGGMVWLLLASGEPRLAAAAPFYGPLPDNADFSGSEAAVLGIYAEQDERVNASREAATAALERAGLTHEIVTYPGANHAFFNDTGPRYHQDAATQAYAKVLEAGHDAIVAEDPDAEIILGGMFGTPLQGQKPAIAAWDYLEKLYKVKGAKKSFDGVAPHPYAAKFSQPGSQRSVLGQIELFRDEIKDARDRNASLWFTELGWASGGPPNPLNRGEAGQAKRLKEAFKYFKRKRGRWNIETVDWYSWRDNSTAGEALCEWCPKSGLFSESLEPKPSWNAFTKFTGGS